jgi:hypothetical protein
MLAVGTRLGSYQILAPLGAGGMGEIYRATDTKLDREVEGVEGRPDGQSLVSPEISRQRSATPSSAAHRST